MLIQIMKSFEISNFFDYGVLIITKTFFCHL